LDSSLFDAPGRLGGDCLDIPAFSPFDDIKYGLEIASDFHRFLWGYHSFSSFFAGKKRAILVDPPALGADWTPVGGQVCRAYPTLGCCLHRARRRRAAHRGEPNAGAEAGHTRSFEAARNRDGCDPLRRVDGRLSVDP
jgi:hypothetical protein